MTNIRNHLDLLRRAQLAAITATIELLTDFEPIDLDGEAAIILDDARTRFVRFLKAEGVGENASHGGWCIPVLPEAAIRRAAAAAFCEVLQSEGIDTVPTSSSNLGRGYEDRKREFRPPI